MPSSRKFYPNSRSLLAIAVSLALLSGTPVTFCQQRSAFFRLKLPKTDRLDGVIYINTGWSIMQCGNACLANPSCDGMTYGQEYLSYTSCYLHSGRAVASGVPDPAFNYYEIERSFAG